MIELTNFKEYKEKYPYYCEVIIDKDGKIYKARPSHQEALIQLYAETFKMITDDVHKKFHNDIDFLDHIIKELGSVLLIWYNNIEYFNKTLTYKQIESARKLYNEGLISCNIDDILTYPFYIINNNKHYIWHHSCELRVDATMMFGESKEPDAYDMYMLCNDKKNNYLLKMIYTHPVFYKMLFKARNWLKFRVSNKK